ncbi:MAG: hypothetical protein E7042_08525 [Lentisphaerae bacterium]|nr:hypothetical protein [Lentisphaerota bacterium]
MKKFRYILRYYIDPGYEEDARIKELVNFCKRSSIEEVMLFFNPEEVNNGHITIEELSPWLTMAKKIKSTLNSNGIALSINPWETLLHSPRGRCLKPGQNFRLMVGETGKNNGVTTCPLCENWLAYICELWAFVAKELQPDAMWIEDDWRLHNHGRILGWGGCFCDEHLRIFCERAGINSVSREELIEKVYGAGVVHPWRKIWFDLNGELMLEPIKTLREAVRSASPRTRIALMCGGTDINSLEGRNWHALQDAAGFDPAFQVRPTMSPYTEVRSMMQYPVPARMIVAALKRPLEICPELETGPRHGIYSKSNSFIGWQLEQCAAFGAHAITLNHFDMLGCGICTAPGFDKVLNKKYPRLCAIKELDLDDDNSLGANILFSTEVSRYVKAEKSGINQLNGRSQEWGNVAEILGFSHRYTTKIESNSKQVTLVSGQTLNAFGDDEVKKLLSGRVILDAVAAAGLIARGFEKELGLKNPVRHYHNVSAYSYEEIDESDASVYGVPYPRLTLQRACRQLWQFTPVSDEVKILSKVKKFDHSDMFGCTFCYRNPSGGTVAVLATPMGDQGDSEWFYMGYFSPFRRIFLQRLLRCVAPEMAIAFTEDFPCQTSRVKYDGGEFFAALNSTTDTAEKIVIRINQMPKGTIEILTDSGAWEQCGKVKITDLGNNDALLLWERPLEPLSGLIFRIQQQHAAHQSSGI